MVTQIDKWNELDSAAQSNLNSVDLDEFYRYKELLQKDGHNWANDAYDILSGFIWNATECYPAD